MSIELCFASNGCVIGNREKHIAIDLTFGEMFRIVHEFLNECHRKGILTDFGKVNFKRLKEGDGSPYPIIVSDGKRERQLNFDDVKEIGRG